MNEKKKKAQALRKRAVSTLDWIPYLVQKKKKKKEDTLFHPAHFVFGTFLSYNVSYGNKMP